MRVQERKLRGSSFAFKRETMVMLVDDLERDPPLTEKQSNDLLDWFEHDWLWPKRLHEMRWEDDGGAVR